MKTRIISAVVAIAIAIPFIYLGGYPYKIAIGLIALWSYKEIISFINPSIKVYVLILEKDE